MVRIWIIPAILILMTAGSVELASAQEEKKWAVELEGGAVWMSRNEIRIPNETGTDISTDGFLGYGLFRIGLAYDVNDRHGLRFVLASLGVRGTGGTFSETSNFAGETFEPDVPTDLEYGLGTLRFTYRYRFYEGPMWRWKIGFTGTVRGTFVSLEQPEKYREYSDVGFFPLAYIGGEARLSERWRFVLDFEGFAIPQERLLDLAAQLKYSISNRWELTFGYRTIEAGMDREEIFNSAWFNYAVGSIRFRF
jgi:hypothetical protein